MDCSVHLPSGRWAWLGLHTPVGCWRCLDSAFSRRAVLAPMTRRHCLRGFLSPVPPRSRWKRRSQAGRQSRSIRLWLATAVRRTQSSARLLPQARFFQSVRPALTAQRQTPIKLERRVASTSTCASLKLWKRRGIFRSAIASRPERCLQRQFFSTILIRIRSSSSECCARVIGRRTSPS